MKPQEAIEILKEILKERQKGQHFDTGMTAELTIEEPKELDKH